MITLHETTPAQNWRGIRKPDWLDECTRLYDGVTLNSDGNQYRSLLAHFDGKKTTLYATNNGFNVAEAHKAIHELDGPRAAYRKCVTEFFRKHEIEVIFA